MIDLTVTMEKFAFYAGLSEAQAAAYRPLAVSSAEKIEALLRPGIGTKHIPLLASAAAADTYYYYCLLAGSRTDSTVTAGAVTVKTDTAAQTAAAKVLRDNAFAAIRHLLRDDGFFFRGV